MFKLEQHLHWWLFLQILDKHSSWAKRGKRLLPDRPCSPNCCVQSRDSILWCLMLLGCSLLSISGQKIFNSHLLTIAPYVCIPGGSKHRRIWRRRVWGWVPAGRLRGANLLFVQKIKLEKNLVLRLYLERICLLKCTVMFLVAGYSCRLHTEDWSVKL